MFDCFAMCLKAFYLASFLPDARSQSPGGGKNKNITLRQSQTVSAVIGNLKTEQLGPG